MVPNGEQAHGGATFNQYYAPTDKLQKPCSFVLDRGFRRVGFHRSGLGWRHFGVMVSRLNRASVSPAETEPT